MKKLKEILKKLFDWWRHSAEGSHGTASGRRLSAMVLTIVCYITGRIWFMFEIHDPYYLLIALCLDIIFIGLLWGYVNFQQIVELKNGNKNNKSKEEDKGDGNSDSSNSSQ